MGLMFLVACAAIMFGFWRRSFAAAWFCFFLLELIRRLAIDTAALFVG
jgi:hypothetical protein